MNKYEAMFVLENGFAGKEWEPVEAALREIFERFGAEVESMEKWAERRLAYEINKQRRATYAHAVFQLDPQQVTPMRDFCTLDERILRFLILRFDADAQKHLPSDTLFATRGRPGDRPTPRPAVGAPKADEPKADAPKADEPKADEPAAEEPKADEPAAEEPKTDETNSGGETAGETDEETKPEPVTTDPTSPASPTS